MVNQSKHISVSGFSVIEMVVAMGISTIIAVAAGSFLGDVMLNAKKAELATEVQTDIDIASKFLERDLQGAGVNLNTIATLSAHLPEEEGPGPKTCPKRDFFIYYPFVPSAAAKSTEGREITLSLDTTKYGCAVSEFVFLTADSAWNYPLMFSPRRGYLSGGGCSEANSLTYNNNCLFNSSIIPEAKKEFGNDIMTATAGSMFLLQIPEYFKNLATPNRLTSYSFLASSLAPTGVTGAMNFTISSSPSSSTTAVQSNLYSAFKSSHPIGTYFPANIDQYLKNVPFYAGEGTSFNVSKVRLVKYLVEKRKVAGRDSTGLYRIELERKADNQFVAKGSTLLAEGFEALKLKRKYINDPIINVTFDRQFRLNGKTKAEEF